MIVIRPAVESDIEAIATVNIQSWKETYPGIMPAKKLAALNLERCIRNWQLSMQSGTFVFVAEREGQIVGFVSGGKNRTSEISECGLGDACDCELAAIYILRKHHRHRRGHRKWLPGGCDGRGYPDGNDVNSSSGDPPVAPTFLNEKEMKHAMKHAMKTT